MYTIVPSLALKYGEQDVAAAAVLVSIAASFLTLTIWLAVVGALGWLPA